ncbi:MAG: hypothetical protein R3321_15045 [Nitrososphaeraceae archaeon]|nr:hypothetical protein [Nitrososphaeraceae archaeon]
MLRHELIKSREPYKASDGYYHYVYVAYNESNRPYIGKHSTINLNDNYKTSSTNDKWLNSEITIFPKFFCETEEDALLLEGHLLSLIPKEKRPMYGNLSFSNLANGELLFNQGVGKTRYMDPNNHNDRRWLSREEADSLGFIHCNSGYSTFMNPNNEKETRYMTSEEAEKIGWVSTQLGYSTYQNPLNKQEFKRLTKDEAERLGWVNSTIGKGLYYNPDEPNIIKRLTKEEANSLGFIPYYHGLNVSGEDHANYGKYLYESPDKKSRKWITHEKAKELGWKPFNTNRKAQKYKCLYCNKIIGNKGNMGQHIKKIHKNKEVILEEYYG